MIVVNDTSPISNLILIGELSLLKDVFHEVVVPSAVDEEIRKLEAFNINLSLYTHSDWIKVISPKRIESIAALNLELDLGEAEAIILAGEVKADLLLIDERLGSLMARKKG